MNISILIRTEHRSFGLFNSIEQDLLKQLTSIEGISTAIGEYGAGVEELPFTASTFILLYRGGEIPAIDPARTFCIFFDSSKFRDNYTSMRYAGATTYKGLRQVLPYIFGRIEVLSSIQNINLHQSEIMRERNVYFKATAHGSMTGVDLVVAYVLALCES